jgi:nucleoside-diphosphate-sugar epimerase
MKVFITGGTGFIGNRLTERLVADKHNVVLLVRNPDGKSWFPDPGIKIIKGDISDIAALETGMTGCDLVFHLAALTKPWSKDPTLAHRTNAEGTSNVLETALKCRVAKVVMTSTGGTLSYSSDGKPADESKVVTVPYHTDYESTKAESENIARAFSSKGLNVTIVNPTRVYGPGKLSMSNSVTKIVSLYIRGLWRLMPGDGRSIGNYVFIDDVVEGLMLAAISGKSGERYILGGENISYRDLYRMMGEASGCKRAVIYIPAGIIKIPLSVVEFFFRLIGKTPPITSNWLDKYLKNWILSSSKAEKELNYRITPFQEGVKKTIEWLKAEKNIDGK